MTARPGRERRYLVHQPLHDLVCRFQSAFDQHDWDGLSRCLGERLFTDYSSFRGTPPSTVARDDYIGLRRAALSALRMQHNFSNLRVEIDGQGDGARARGFCNYAILRFGARVGGGETPFFHSYGRYVFDFERSTDCNWVICGITQILLENVGDATIHEGARPR